MVFKRWMLAKQPSIIVTLLLATLAFCSSAVRAAEDDTPKIPPKTYVLILFLYDLNKNYHALRVATYVNAENCNKSGKNVLTALNRGTLQNQNYVCLEADLPY